MLTIILFEWRYLLRRPATWVYFFLLFALGFLFMSTDAVELGGGVGKIFKNSPFVIAQSSVILTFVGSIITTALAGTAILRDFELNAHAMFFTKPISKAQYLFGRFIGSWLVMLVVYTAVPLGLMLGSAMPWIEASKIGPFSIMAFVQPYVLFVVPNIFVISAIFFAVGTLTRSMFAVFVQGIGLFVAYSISGTIVKGLENTHIASALDLYAIRSFFFETRYWTVFEKNTQMVSLGEYLLVNRLIWISVAIGILGLCYRLFSFNVQPMGDRKKGTSEAEVAVESAVLLLPQVRQRFGRSFDWSSLLMLTRTYVRSVTRDKLFLALAVIGMINTLFASYNADSLFGTTVYPTTYLMLETLSTFSFFILLISTFYGGELIWRERRFKAHQIVDALPVPTWASFTSKYLSLVVAQMIVVAALYLAAIIMQLSKGYTNIEVMLYIREYFTVTFFRVAIFSMYALSVHSLVNHKYIGHFVTVLFYVGVIALPALDLDHILLQFLSLSEGTYSAMNGFGSFLARQYSLTLYWTLFCLALSWAAYILSVRGSEEIFAQRVRAMRARMNRKTLTFGVASGAGTLCLAGFIYYNTDILNKRLTEDEVRHQSAIYEQRYNHFERKAQPHIIASTIHLNLQPEQSRFDAQGDFVLLNTFEEVIDTVMVTFNDDKKYDDMYFDRRFREVKNDGETGVRLYVLEPALAAHDSCRFHFHMVCENHGFQNSSMNTSIVENGTFLNNSIFPHIGYLSDVELGDEDDRRKEGLAKQERMPSIDDQQARMRNYISSNTDWMRFEVTISTAPDQIAISPGYLQREWMENGRRYFHYKMDAPILGFYSMLSARYQVHRDSVNGVQLEIYYHKGHEANLERMTKGMKQALTYCGSNFAPYQFRQLRILEFPRYAQFAQSFPNTVPYSESIGFIARIKSEEDVDYAFYVTAHEVAHQWWGHQVVGASVQGATMLSESFAEYSALMVMKHEYGDATMKKFLKFALNSYLRGRSSERSKELPLYLNENQQYLHYNKGSLVLYAVADYIGEDSLNAALSRFCHRYRFGSAPYPTTKDFMSELKKVVPDSLSYLIEDNFETITLYDNRIKEAKCAKRADGKYDVDLVVESRKMRADSLGHETPRPLNDYIDIGLFDANEDPRTKLGKRLTFARHKLSSAESRFHFVLNEKPAKAGIDPYNKLIDRDAEDNVMKVESD